MTKLILRWAVNALAIFAISFIPGIEVRSFAMLFIVALVLGLLNAIVRPVLFWLTLPITVLTLGLFLIVLNAFILKLTDWFLPGFVIEGFVPAVLGAVALSIISFFTSWIGREKKSD